MLKDKNIILGVSGGIAVYKAVEIVSRLKKSGAIVHVIMTEAAAKFVTPLTFREMSGNPVVVSMWNETTNWNVEHIALAMLADVMLIAPATANIIGKAANGIADDMLLTTLMATKAPVFFSPAMNTNMYLNPIVQANLKKLQDAHYHLIQPDSGQLACGTSGVGRLPAPESIVGVLAEYFSETVSLRGKKVLVTAAGTREPIDPVRYIGNRSSGKMGYALAEEAARRGANVVLISGPSALQTSAAIRLIKIETALQMRDAVKKEFIDSDIIIKAAAVADYRASSIAENKIKKDSSTLTLTLEKNPDILFELGQIKQKNQILVGFAAETQNLLEFAKIKLHKKNLDYIIANDVTAPNAGFNTDTNIVKIIDRNGVCEDFPLLHKDLLAKIILDKITTLPKI
ncbi:bifunctional phosphopantothenoylcysteine decarboxylase/phosphopantothenate--cysteine ligase CoaBC [Propionispira raffinosivorans]|uniref:bifunctional phosphopantothenoylcysteine decarboxylase/phosphopantothenate--cysteine ligase CoaBC n=1 Tax=Propionispira raffinosivorans TaxID=86959 RepID=UPI00036AFFB2|nr:bifunctional phosphopantothenoylcysteine decarboxylase/phosphopantothenate--cysteine ligase CoaBC [Propionispira raffinosivorans]